MGLFETFTLALKNIWSSKMRTFLTMLGIIIGVMAVIVIMSLGNGMTNKMREQFADMGVKNLSVYMFGWDGGTRKVTVDDMYDIIAADPERFEGVTPEVGLGGTVKVGTEQYPYTSIKGVGENYFEVETNYELDRGRPLQYMDVLEHRSVCVLGGYLAENAFIGDPIGQTLKIGPNKFTVVGTLKSRNKNGAEQGGTDDWIFMPYSTAARVCGAGSVDQYTVRVRDENTLAESREVLEEVLRERLGGDSGFMVYSMGEMLGAMTGMVDIVVTILSIIAGISLLVGGIGIMNIMLVSVTERTREIGIRKALGAKESSILTQFVIEAATTSALGGVIGIGLGCALANAATPLVRMLVEEEITASPSLNSILIAFGISTGIGILFGYLPARKAARLNPIDALRYD